MNLHLLFAHLMWPIQYGGVTCLWGDLFVNYLMFLGIVVKNSNWFCKFNMAEA